MISNFDVLWVMIRLEVQPLEQNYNDYANTLLNTTTTTTTTTTITAWL